MEEKGVAESSTVLLVAAKAFKGSSSSLRRCLADSHLAWRELGELGSPLVPCQPDREMQRRSGRSRLSHSRPRHSGWPIRSHAFLCPGAARCTRYPMEPYPSEMAFTAGWNRGEGSVLQFSHILSSHLHRILLSIRRYHSSIH